jgi:hypothetical protein
MFHLSQPARSELSARSTSQSSSSSSKSDTDQPRTQPGVIDKEPLSHPHDGSYISSKLRLPLASNTSNYNIYKGDSDLLYRHIDPIEKDIPARLGLKDPFKSNIPELIEHAPAFIRRSLLLISEYDVLERDPKLRRALPPLLPRPPDEVKRRTEQKGVPSSKSHLTLADAIIKYIEQPDPQAPIFSVDTATEPLDAIYYKDPELEKLYKRSVDIRRSTKPGEDASSKYSREQISECAHIFRATAFTAPKADKCDIPNCPVDSDQPHHKLRLVADGRIANAHLQNPVPMEVFRLELLFDVVARCKKIVEDRSQADQNSNAKPAFYAVSADQRHWFHQIPLPRRFRASYTVVIDTSSRGPNRPLPKNIFKRIYFPRSWPMGASPAAGIGQAVTWAALLHKVEADTKLRRSLGIRLPDGKTSFDTYLPWLPLQCGGGVFVLIDNIFIITTSKKLAENWRNRILSVADTFNIRLKTLDKKNNTQVIVNAITPTSGEAEFTGVKFSWAGRRPRDLADKVPALDALLLRPDRLTTNATYTTTFRQLASVLGQCLWQGRIFGLPIYRNSEYKQVSAIAYPVASKKEDWDSNVEIAGPELQSLLNLYERCSTEQPPTPHPKPLQKIETVAFMASDASYADFKARRGACFTLLKDDTKTVHKFEFPTVPDPNTHIGIEELGAVVDGIQEMKKFCSIPGSPKFPDLIVLGIDSTHAKGMIVNSVARSPEALSLLQRLDELLGTSRLHLVQVPSLENPADALTRDDKKWCDELWSNLANRLAAEVPFAIFNMENMGYQKTKQAPQRRN